MNDLKIIKLPPERWEEYKNLRLEALKDSPASFSKSYELIAQKPDEYWKDAIKKYEGVEGVIFFAQANGKLIGMIGIDYKSDPKIKHSVTIAGFYVTPEFRNKGVGKKLFIEAIENIKTLEGVIKIDLDVNTDNTTAINMYKSFGFEITGTYNKELFIDGKYYDLYEMEKFL